jgi:hypothetical protein
LSEEQTYNLSPLIVVIQILSAQYAVSRSMFLFIFFKVVGWKCILKLLMSNITFRVCIYYPSCRDEMTIKAPEKLVHFSQAKHKCFSHFGVFLNLLTEKELP